MPKKVGKKMGHRRHEEAESSSSSESSDEGSTSESESDSGSESDDYVDQQINSRSSQAHEETFDLTEEQIDISSLPIDEETKKLISSGLRKEVLTFDYTGSLHGMNDGKESRIEVSAIAKDSPLAQQLAEIQMISFIECDNKFPVDIKITHNGFPGSQDQKITSHSRGGASGEYIAGSATEDKGRKDVLYCQTKRVTSNFLSRHKGTSLKKITDSVRQIEGRWVTDEGSPFLDYVQNEMKVALKPTEDFYFIPKSVKETAESRLKKQFNQRNVGTLADLTITLQRSFRPEGKLESAWNDATEISSRLAVSPKITKESVDKEKEKFLHLPHRIQYKLEVLYKPISS
jgi:hypothetical protein